MGNLSALLFFCLCFAVPLLSPTIRRDRNLLMAAYLSLALRDAVALINAFVTPILASWGDLYRFHNIGAGIDMERGQPYGEFLRVLYRIFGTSFWLGEQSSILAYTLSLVVFVEIGVLIGAREKLLGCVLLFGCLPSPAIHCSVTLRESYQVLSFLSCAYALLRLRSRPDPWAWFVLFGSIVGMVYMHHGLGAFAAGVLALGVPWALQGRGHFGAVLALLCLTLVPLLLPKMLDVLGEQSLSAEVISEGRLLEFAAKYRNFVSEARSDYGLKIDPENLLSFTITSALVIAMFFVAPLPWQASSAMDYYAFFEVILRFVLLFGFVRQLAILKGENRQRILFLFVLAMTLECLWAIGTTNWGTSLRHHVVAFGIFVLVGLPYYAGLTLNADEQAFFKRRAQRTGEVGDVEVDPVGVDLLALFSFLRARRRLFLSITLISALVIVALTRPKTRIQAPLTPTYLSSGTLLLSFGQRFQLKDLAANTIQRSDLELWLSSETLFSHLLERQRVYARIEARLKTQSPQLLPFCRSVSIRPLYQEVEVVNIYDGSGRIEVDYAQFSQTDAEVSARQRRASRLAITAVAASPADSEKLVRVTMSVLQEALQEVATKRIRAQRKSIEGYIRVGARKIARAEQALKKKTPSEPGRLLKLAAERKDIENMCRRLGLEIDDLKRQIELERNDSDFRQATQVNPVQSALQVLQSERLLAQQTYMPDSLAFQRVEERLQRTRQLALQVDAANADKAVASLQATLVAKQALLRQYQEELRRIQSSLPSIRDQSEFRERERGLNAWLQENLVWEQQLLRVRIEERLCQGDGTALPLTTPRPGVRSFAATQQFLALYRKPLTLLPLAPLLGLIGVALGHLLTQVRDVRRRAEHFLGAPVLGEIPRIARDDQRNWLVSLAKGPGP
ncbi:hypothetical protein IV102_19830 [bacterium]|nr:hypothetical protein [bacterium]